MRKYVIAASLGSCIIFTQGFSLNTEKAIPEGQIVNLGYQNSDYAKGDMKIVNGTEKKIPYNIKLEPIGSTTNLVGGTILKRNDSINASYILDSPHRVITHEEAKESCKSTETKSSASTTIKGSLGLSKGPFSSSLEASHNWEESITNTVNTCESIKNATQDTYENFLLRAQAAGIEMEYVDNNGESILGGFGIVIIPTGTNVVRISSIERPNSDSKIKLKIVDRNGKEFDLDKGYTMKLNNYGSTNSDYIQFENQNGIFSDISFKVEYTGSYDDFIREVAERS